MTLQGEAGGLQRTGDIALIARDPGELGFLLFVITFIVLGFAKWMLVRAEKAKGL